KLIAFLQEHGFKTLLARTQAKLGIQAAAPGIPSNPIAPAPADIKCDYTVVRDISALTAWMEKARKAGYVAFDTETTSLNVQQAELVGFSLCVEPGVACYVPLGHKGGEPSAL